MMDRGWFAPFKGCLKRVTPSLSEINAVVLGVFCCFLFWIGCATIQNKKEAVKFHAVLSQQEVMAGTVIFITANLEGSSQNSLLRGRFEDIQFPFFPLPADEKMGVQKFGAILGVPYEAIPGSKKIILEVLNDQSLVAHSTLELPVQILTGMYPSEVLHVDPRRVRPVHPLDLKRIQEEQKILAALYDHVTLHRYWQGPFLMPLNSKVTSPFGIQRLYNNIHQSHHSGLDLRASVNTRVLCAAAGKVILAQDLFYTGNTVILDHGYGVMTLYAHLNRLKVHEGEILQAHQLVGLSGQTGRVNGPHLHWQAMVHKIKVNPVGLTQVVW